MKEFKLNDEVYLMSENRICRGIINGKITIEKTRQPLNTFLKDGFHIETNAIGISKEVKRTYQIHFSDGSFGEYHEDVLFDSKEKLIEYLIQS